MRRVISLIVVVMTILSAVITVSAATGASSVESVATVSSDGSCQVSINVTFHMEQAVDKLYFPVPADASGVTVNGSRVVATKSGDARRIDLSRMVGKVVGDVTVNIHYSIRDAIYATETDGLELRLPLLNGFAYPVESLSFSVTMPGPIDALPTFVSGYHQARIEEYLRFSTDGATVSGYSLKSMKDHETLTMHVLVTEEMFPQTLTRTVNYDMGATAMLICGLLALIYWLIAMWNLPVWPRVNTDPPHGFTAGQIGCITAGQGVDLTLAVFTWAQLGYLTIQTDRNGRVLLHKRMDMGNERGEFERRTFQKMFGKRDVVDTSGLAYASLCRQVAKRPAGIQELIRSRSGNPKVFRVLASGIGLFGGASLAIALAGGAALQGLLLFVMGVAGAVSGWTIQDVGAGILLRDRRKWISCGIVGAIWLLLGLVAGDFQLGLWMVLSLTLAGILLAWGGRRTDFGRQILSEVAGLHRYLTTADKKRLQQICTSDPDYFFRLAPWAMALGVDREFAKRFGSAKLSDCPYLLTGTETAMTAQSWCKRLQDVAAAMNARADRLPLERLIKLLQNLTR